MKKKLLSFSVIFSFLAYTAFQRMGILSNQSTYTATPPTDKMTSQPNVPASAPVSNAPLPASQRAPSVSRGIFGDDNSFEGEDEEGGFISSKTPAPTPSVQTATPAPAAASAPAPSSAVAKAGLYRDGKYTGPITDAYYGNVQVAVAVSGGKITDVQFLDYPHDRNTSIRINSYAMPILKSEAIAAQSANVDTVSGATATSGAFYDSLSSALAQAKN